MRSKSPLNRSLRILAVLAAVALPALANQEPEGEAKAPPLSIDEILVEPAQPAADTLCKLRVKLGNSGTETASQLAFRVALNGQEREEVLARLVELLATHNQSTR